jgi:hypothetical protein
MEYICSVNVLDVDVPFLSSSDTSIRRKNSSAVVLVQVVAIGTDTLVVLLECLPLKRDAVPS